MERVRWSMMLILGVTLLTAGVAPLRAIEVQESQVAQTSAQSGGFELSFKPVKDIFTVGDRIQFKVKGNKGFYLYLFSVKNDRTAGSLLLPTNPREPVKLTAKKDYVVPEGVDLIADRVGEERVFVVASTSKLDLKLDKYKKSGDFLSAGANEVEEDVKALRVFKRDEKVSMEVKLMVVGGGQRPGAAPSPGTMPPAASSETPQVGAFVATDRPEYRVGNSIKINFGAEQKGYVLLYLVEPDGKRTMIQKQEVDGKSFYQLTAKASSPAGEHKLIAVYDEKGDEKALKGLSIMGAPAVTEPHIVFRIRE